MEGQSADKSQQVGHSRRTLTRLSGAWAMARCSTIVLVDPAPFSSILSLLSHACHSPLATLPSSNPRPRFQWAASACLRGPRTVTSSPSASCIAMHLLVRPVETIMPFQSVSSNCLRYVCILCVSPPRGTILSGPCLQSPNAPTLRSSRAPPALLRFS